MFLAIVRQRFAALKQHIRWRIRATSNGDVGQSANCLQVGSRGGKYEAVFSHLIGDAWILGAAKTWNNLLAKPAVFRNVLAGDQQRSERMVADGMVRVGFDYVCNVVSSLFPSAFHGQI